MKVLVCFDVDGTLETSSGPIHLALLDELIQRGARVAIVSPSSARPLGRYPEFVNGSRRDNLRLAKLWAPSDLYLYVSDNGDVMEAEAAGFTYVDRMSFRLS